MTESKASDGAMNSDASVGGPSPPPSSRKNSVQPHVEYLLGMSAGEFYAWHSRRPKGEVVMSLFSVLEDWRAERGAKDQP